ncbi:MAG: hypothetical protein IPJ30_16375 [Acidobacteria bacterium]|nr:hypothetical protein [Acidobacteriota bacterium]
MLRVALVRARSAVKVAVKATVSNPGLMGVESIGLGPNGNCWRYGKLLRAEDALNEAMHQAGAFAFDDRDLARAYSKAKKIDAPDYGWKTKADVETRKK